ncbi:MAG: DUF1697 domain-containing protein [Paludibacter sp.]|jgi:uncharacterized protein (DUF1697 family)|nr:DUF1697 domain-containing protein [Paludibacter sp.]
MNKIKYLALLRGINVGGNNIIKMNELKNLFHETGFSDVITYIQSGNIIFNAVETDKQILIEKIRNKLFEKLKTEINIAILTLSEMTEIICEKPEKFGEDNYNYKYDVVFLIEPLTANEAIKKFEPKEGVDKIEQGTNVLYFSRLQAEYTKSRLSKIAGSSIYKNISIRNWNTTEKLYELMK